MANGRWLMGGDPQTRMQGTLAGVSTSSARTATGSTGRESKADGGGPTILIVRIKHVRDSECRNTQNA